VNRILESLKVIKQNKKALEELDKKIKRLQEVPIHAVRNKKALNSLGICTLMKKTLAVLVERDGEGWYVGSVPELPGCHTQAKTLDALMERIKEAIGLYLEVEPDILQKEES
jgi:predicted RNase H-like HicB family nuclease